MILRGHVLQYDFEESVGYWIVMSAHALQRALNEELAPHGITYRQWQVLAWLALEGSLSQNELAERMNIEPATLVSVLARMERAGWIGRRACAEDRRKRMVFPKAKSKAIWEKGIQCAHRVREHATQGFTAEEREQLKKLLAAVLNNMRQPQYVEADVA
jgi:MarR family transcriptional regulator for hemolysin